MQKARRHPGIAPIGLRPLVGMWFQVQYPPLTGVLPIFRSRYLFTIGRQRVLSLGRWTSQIQTRFHVTGFTRGHTRRRFTVAYGTVTRYGRAFQNVPLGYLTGLCPVLQPRKGMPLRFRLIRVRSRYWFTIGRQRVLSLAGWAPQIRTDFHVSGPTQVPNRRAYHAAYGTVTRYGRSFQSSSARVQAA